MLTVQASEPDFGSLKPTLKRKGRGEELNVVIPSVILN